VSVTEHLQVGDQVELLQDIAGRKELRARRRGVVVMADDGLAWGFITIVLLEVAPMELPGAAQDVTS
jgi:hypothetical protein